MLTLSGGKDSTALLLMLLERGIDPGDVVYFDTGWDFPQIYDHLEKLEKFTGITFVRLRTEKPFDYWMFEYEYEHRNGEIVRGYGFPTFKTRWCTRMKQDTISDYWRKTGKPVKYVGIAYDEKHRVKSAESGRLLNIRRLSTATKRDLIGEASTTILIE